MIRKAEWKCGRSLQRAGAAVCLLALTPGASLAQTGAIISTNAETFLVRTYELRGAPQFLSDAPNAEFFSNFTGTNLPLKTLVGAAAAVQAEFGRKGLPQPTVAISPEKITNGLLAMHIFRGGENPQIVVAGRPYTPAGDLLFGPVKKEYPAVPEPTATATAANAATNTGPKFTVNAYAIAGNTLLSEEILSGIFAKYTGTNVGVPEILKAAGELQTEYRERAFPTVNVTVPPQQITNEIVRIQVFEGVLSKVEVVNNKYFSSNNVMRALPSLKPGILLNSRVFQAELDRANANQDRQIYPQIEPGSKEGTTALRLKVEDRLPLHGKIDFNNQFSPGTPELRVNSSAIYNNLWQYEHSLGVQYNFSPEKYKPGDWEFYDQPLVANYSAFYRMPLSSEPPVAQTVNANPTSFGFDEATRRFRLPASSGRPELNIFASRSTIDTDVLTLSERQIQNIPGALSITESDQQQDITINKDVGLRLSLPLRATDNFHSGFSWGVDYKEYSLASYKTNLFFFDFITVNPNGTTNPPVRSVNISAVPPTQRSLDYVPLVLRYDGALKDDWGSTSFGVGLGGNAWYSGDVRALTASRESSGHWVVLNPSIGREFVFHTNWVLSMRADGQWANEPLISNEQFSAGGINSVRGYHEGEVFGDTGWHVSVEQKTPPHVVGAINSKTPLTIRGSIYMDYARVYLLDPLGRKDEISLWGAGLGAVISLGTHWESRFLFSLPFERTGITTPYQPRFDFSLTTQF